MPLQLFLGACVGGLLMLVPVLRARAFARRQEEERRASSARIASGSSISCT